MLGYFLIALVFAVMGGIVGVLLDYFGNRKTFPWYVQATCFISFFFPFTIIVILPVDLASTRYRDCSASNATITEIDCDMPLAYVSEDFLYGFWQVVYWITFNVQMFIVPVMQGYVRSGEITFFRRFKSGVMENITFYAICGGVGLIFVLYAIFGLHISASDLITLAIPAANAYGLVLLTILMGYGLVEIPRGLWYNADVQWVMRYLEYKAPKLKEACLDSEAEIYQVARLIGHASRKIPNGDPLRPLVDKMMEKCPLALQQRAIGDEGDDLPPAFTRDKLIDLHARIRRAAFADERNQAQLRYLLQHAFVCQDIVANRASKDRRFKSVFLTVPDTDPYKDQKLQAYWWWLVWIKPIAMRALCVTCIVLSALVVWSESTFQITSVRLSIPSLFLEPGRVTYGALEIFSVAFVCYMCTCTYSTLLNINIFEYYQMVPEHHTDEVSMLFVGAYLCKLTFPLCYNFLNMGGLAEGKATNTTQVDYSSSPVFIQYLGPAVNLTPLFGSGYNDWVAHLILITCVIIILNLHGRILRLFRIDHYFYEPHKSNGVDTEEGQSIIQQSRAIEERRLQRGGAAGGHDAAPSAATSRYQGQSRNARELVERYKNRSRDTGNAAIDRLATSSTGGPIASASTAAAGAAAGGQSGNRFALKSLNVGGLFGSGYQRANVNGDDDDQEGLVAGAAGFAGSGAGGAGVKSARKFGLRASNESLPIAPGSGHAGQATPQQPQQQQPAKSAFGAFGLDAFKSTALGSIIGGKPMPGTPSGASGSHLPPPPSGGGHGVGGAAGRSVSAGPAFHTASGSSNAPLFPPSSAGGSRQHTPAPSSKPAPKRGGLFDGL
ncbi:LMBR1-like membrane protein-domain-containing protein [Entophlyctis helioformis]|nr:LMBR1-like membrane protein-domain-containing protein [Entophlyctis helioformis]